MKADTPLTLNSEVQQAVVSRFLTLMAEGDWPALLALLTEDAVAISDGGGKVFAARKPITGHEAIVHFLRRLKELAPPTTHLEPISVNGQWGWQIHVDGQLMAVMIPQISTQGKIIGLYNILNPDKLSHLVRAD
jgi:RNA polymerase sigma-70 factor (ECF subfamily)